MNSETYCLALYDLTRIQEYIFDSPRTAENLGASRYVQQIFETHLCNILQTGTIPTDGGLSLPTDHPLPHEIVYIGGGNAMVLFRSKEKAIETTKKLSLQLLNDTRNKLGLAVAYAETALENFTEDQRQLFTALDQQKASRSLSLPLQGISITHECVDGGYSLGNRDKDKNLISVAAAHNLEQNKEQKWPGLAERPYTFPLEFDKLGGEKGEQSHIAVVHIDGNNMGAFIKQQIAEATNYNGAVGTLRTLSHKIKTAYLDTFKQLCDEVQANLNKPDSPLRDIIKCEKQDIPIRPVIISGDDVTFVCDGRIALQLAERFLQILNEKTITEQNLTACAGIAITGSHFPFYHAYDLAETLCANAKRHARKRTTNDNTPIGCWMDYHIVFAGFEAELDSLRRKAYSVPCMDQPAPANKLPQYNLLLRPFPVCGHNPLSWNWSDIVNMSKTFSQWPRSAHKGLRNAFMESESAIDDIVSHNVSRGRTLPGFPISQGAILGPDNIFHNSQTAYFEALEIIDFYTHELQLNSNKATTPTD